jgi:GH35 family endo-1,4-beta-xylanase
MTHAFDKANQVYGKSLIKLVDSCRYAIQKALDKKLHDETEANKHDKLCADVAALCGKTYKKGEYNAENFYILDCRTTAKVNYGGSIRIEIDSLNFENAKKIIEFVRGANRETL